MKQNEVCNNKLFIIYFAAVCTKPNCNTSTPMMNNFISFFSISFLSLFFSFLLCFCTSNTLSFYHEIIASRKF